MLEVKLTDFNLDRVKRFLIGDYDIDVPDKNRSNY